jgi:hypothetical protein
MRSIFVYIFSLILLVSVDAQTTETAFPKALRIGLDLSRYGFFAAERGFLTNEITLDYALKNKNFLVLDIGTISGSAKSQNYMISANGFYSRVGIEHNFLSHPSDVLSIGSRIGMSKYIYSPEDVVFEDPFWGDYSEDIDPQNNSAFWIEAVFGIKTEIFKNFFMGWSASARVMLVSSKSDYFPEYKVPGFGSTKGAVSPGFGFYVYYRFPFKRESSPIN